MGTEKATQNQSIKQKPRQRINTWAIHLVRYSGQSLKGRGRKLDKCIREQENSSQFIRLYIPEMSETDCICQEEKEEENLSAVKIVSIH